MTDFYLTRDKRPLLCIVKIQVSILLSYKWPE